MAKDEDGVSVEYKTSTLVIERDCSPMADGQGKRSRMSGVDLMKGIAILGVLFIHVTNRRYSFGTIETLHLVQCCLAWAIFAFIVSSGFLHGASCREESLHVFCVRRAKRLLGPYFTIGVVYLVWTYAAEIHRNPALGFHWGELVKRLAGYAVFREFGSEQMYFLPLLFLTAVVHEGSIRLLSWLNVPRPGVMMLISTFFAALVVILRATEFSSSFSPYRVTLSLLYYSLGYLLASVPRRRWFVLAVPLSIAGWVVAWVRKDASHPAIAMGLTWVVFYLCMEAPRGLPGRSLFEFLGRMSSFIFVYHSPLVIHSIIRGLCRVGLGDWWVIGLSVVLTVLVCAACYQVVRKCRPLHFLEV